MITRIPTYFKSSVSILVSLSLLISSCATIEYSTKVTTIPDSERFIGSYYNCQVHNYPNKSRPDLGVSFRKVEEYEFRQEEVQIKKTNNEDTRLGGWVTMLSGAALAGLVAVGGEKEDGSYSEPAPEAAKVILIGSIAIGLILAIIPNTKKKVSSDIVRKTYEEYKPVQDSVYHVWSNVYPEKVIARELISQEINLDVSADLGLDFIENQDTITVHFQPESDRDLVYTVDFLASDYLSKYLNVNGISDSVSLYQAPTLNSPVVGHLKKGDNLDLIEVKPSWYKARWHDKNIYLQTREIGYFYAYE